MINKLYKYGIRDKRLLMVIKKILKAGIMEENKTIEVNEIGTPQGGTLSPLLANIYLTDFDLWVNEQWNDIKTTKHIYSNRAHKNRALKQTKLKRGYLIRYADDWVIITDSEDSAIKWKYACQKFLREKLKLELSEEKTLVTDLSKTSMNFLGITSWVTKGSNDKLTLRSKPESERLKDKMKDVYKALRKIRKSKNDGELLESITYYNQVIRGINNFYRITTLYNLVLSKEEWKLKDAWLRTKRTTKLKRVKTKNCQNLYGRAYEKSQRHTLAYVSKNVNIGLEILGIGKFTIPRVKAQWMTPYSEKGRDKYEEIHNCRWNTLPRNPWLTLGSISVLLAKEPKGSIYNLEYFINRPMAFNRDKCRCKVCKKYLDNSEEVNIHHKNKDLPIDKINKVSNLVTLCTKCHYIEHNKQTKHKKKIVAIKNNPNSSRSAIKPSKEILLEEIKTTSFVQLGKKYGVSDNAVRKWAKSYGIYEQRMIKLKKDDN